MPIKQVIGEGKFPVKLWTEDIDDMAYSQLRNLGNLPFIHKHVAAMPDCHGGRGATIGSVIPTIGAIIPAAVGVDIGCGMMAWRTSLTASDLPDDLRMVRDAIERAVPVGRTANGGRGDRGAWDNMPGSVIGAWNAVLGDRFDDICDKDPEIKKCNNINHLGTLGGGNHFIEVCLDEEQRVWVMLHSGSRGVGNRIGSHFIKKAKKEMERFYIHLPDKDLAYLVKGTEYFDDYWEAMTWAQDFASINRELMMDRVMGVLRGMLPPFQTDKKAINCHHNYTTIEHHYGRSVYLTRKGAIMAREGVLGIIPGSMGVKSYIVSGKGNRESFHSCSHGAGRKMSRTKAKEMFTEADLIEQTAGIECRKDIGVIDEIPGSYKDIDVVMANQEDLVNIEHTLNQVINIKG